MRRPLLTLFCAMAYLGLQAEEKRAFDRMTDHLIVLDRFDQFHRDDDGQRHLLTSPWFSAPMAWTELVPSWNAVCPSNTALKVEVRASDEHDTTPFYNLGQWTTDHDPARRTSVREQKNAWGEVKTDTLVLKRPMARAQVRLELRGQTARPQIKFLSLCFTDTTAARPELPPHRAAWGTVIEVPRRSQLGHPGASGWCSPTAVSMLLAHWAGALHRPELDLPVPEVARGVYDPAWEGTGNWAFNMAYAGQFPGLRAWVARLAGLPAIERLVVAGFPVAASVSFDLLNGKPTDEGTGHLIVVVGFTSSGDIVANDPWPNPKGENSVRRVFPRLHFLNAWQRSRQAVYLIHPAESTGRILELIR